MANEENKTQTRTAIYVRISTAQQKTDRQVVELKDYARCHGINISEDDIYIDIISGFKTGEIRPQYSILKQRVEDGFYNQILFSEFSRLDRKPSNLLKSIEYYQKKGVHLYFKKQNIWIRDKSDIATQIMVSVLAVMNQYEIELFVARGIDGKITAIKNRGIASGGFTAYGYRTSTNGKRLIVDEQEAEVVRRIFRYYDEDRSSLYIADILNSEGIPTPYASRIKAVTEKRQRMGVPAKVYRHMRNYEEMTWLPSTINRLIKNPVYMGVRNFTFFEPDPANPLPLNKRENRKVLHKFEVRDDSLCIVEEDLFKRVNEAATLKAFNRNLGVRHDNLLKDLLRCGECGGNYAVCGGHAGRKYRCYGTWKRCDKTKTCDNGAQLLMCKLDGLIMKMCIRKFVGYDIEKEASERMATAQQMISEKQAVIAEYQAKVKEESENFSAFVRRVIKNASNDDEANSWIADERLEFETRIKIMTDSIERARADVKKYQDKVKAYHKMRGKANLLKRQKEIMEDRNLVREYVRGFISRIDIYRASKLWALVVVHYLDGREMWGTIKTCRYRNSEVVRDAKNPASFEYTGLMIDNDKHLLRYESSDRTIVIPSGHKLYKANGKPTEQVPFEEFCKRATEAGYQITFAKYQFEVE